MDERYIAARERLIAIEDPDNALTIQTRLKQLLAALEQGDSGESRYQARQRESVNNRLQGVDIKTTRAFRYLQSRNLDGLRFKTLCGMMQLVAGTVGLGRALDRDAKRNKGLLIQWMEQHWEVIYPVLEQTGLMVGLPEAEGEAEAD
jgi:hypothetical protein